MLTYLEKKYKPTFWLIGGIGLVGILCIIDTISGYEVSFSLFYIIPISLVSWKTNRSLGVTISLLSAAAWLFADVIAGNSYSNKIIFLWNSCIRLGFFIIIVQLLTVIKRGIEHERELSRIDSMTGVYNNRFFSILLQLEIDRARRYKCPITVAYIDLDNFKVINDQFGHSSGDLVLRDVASYLTANIRKTDVVARLGGDEFAVLLPETSQVSAKVLFARIHQGLLAEMDKKNWPVTFSIGVLSCPEHLSDVDDIINRADNLMYSVKKHGKNAILYETC
jgi:diguanylate cyclase (GGDEF)-like protein